MYTIHQTTQKAKKEYFDDGFENIKEWAEGGFWSNNNKKVEENDKIIITNILKLRPTPKILKRDEYIRQFNADGSDAWTFRTKKIFFDMLSKYDIFTDY